MRIVCSKNYEKTLKQILEEIAKSDIKAAKDFKMYLDTIIINIPTKAKKYKPSIYFDDDRVRDVEYESYTIPFILDEKNETFAILDIVKKNKDS